MITGVMVDSREPEWVQRLAFGGLPVLVTMLAHGDVMCATDDGKMLLVERKTPADFLNSLRDERLLPQLSGMLDHTRWAYLVITGEFLRGAGGKTVADGRDTGWSWTAVQGAMLTIQEMGVFIVHAAGDSDFESCIQRIGTRDRRADLLLTPPKFPRVLSAQEAIIASLPGIGTDRLQAVMEACGSPAWALVALTDATTEIAGIGTGIKRRIRAALKLTDDQQLAVITDDSGADILTVAKLGAQ